MSAAKSSARPRASSKLDVVYDADGNEIKIEAREDEEQNVKLQETVELLVAAGYFRARIKGLSPFDKVVGGMTWCITTCNFDVQVDLLFQESLSIGQKISLTEKLVLVLSRMKCPHRIEPHQIQGLDFIHIFPVIQWLVKKAIETRKEMGDYIRSYAVSQFNRKHTMPQDINDKMRLSESKKTVESVYMSYLPRRKYRRQNTSQVLEHEQDQVQSTLLEYGAKSISTPGVGPVTESSANQQGEEQQAAEEERLSKLMSSLSVSGDEGKVLASTVGSIVGRSAGEIQRAAADYLSKQALLGEGVSKADHHNRLVTGLEKQRVELEEEMEEKKRKLEDMKRIEEGIEQKLDEALTLSSTVDSHLLGFSELEKDSENRDKLETLRTLIKTNEALRRQEQDFKQQCKEDKIRLERDINVLSEGGEGVMSGEDEERVKMIEAKYQADREKLEKIMLLLAKKNREISILQRKIDEVPSRSELNQYQRRFIELYNQVASTHKETKQFYTLYNTLDDTCLHVNKEINLLNSIHDNFQQAMSSNESKQQFLKQLEQIVDGVRQTCSRVEKKKQEEKGKRDQLNDEYLELVEKQRLYYKMIKDFQQECHKNEVLISKIDGIK